MDFYTHGITEVKRNAHTRREPQIMEVPELGMPKRLGLPNSKPLSSPFYTRVFDAEIVGVVEKIGVPKQVDLEHAVSVAYSDGFPTKGLPNRESLAQNR